jgi:hypothetical protein
LFGCGELFDEGSQLPIVPSQILQFRYLALEWVLLVVDSGVSCSMPSAEDTMAPMQGVFYDTAFCLQLRQNAIDGVLIPADLFG